MSIYLIRHGETALNASRTLQPADTPLSPRGLAQAAAIGKRLVDAGVVAIVSSDLPRAAQTASAIAAACGLPIRWEPLLHERNFGDLRGQPYDGLAFDPLTLTEAPPGGESAATFRARVAEAFKRIVALRASLDGNLAVVTHGLVIGAMLEAHARLAERDALPERLGNASLTVLSALPPHDVGLLDCTRHLEGVAADDARSLSGG
jgi:2,3-bisphosphoglycerate-dependent phosphoglycerate mutase